MNIAAVRGHFAAMQSRLSCPVCRQPLTLQCNSFKCADNHCFDLAAQNYLNLAPQKSQAGNKYNAALFQARRQVFAAGIYEPLLRELSDICNAYQADNPTEQYKLLDAGCGEGYFAASLANLAKLEVLALDLAKSAVQLAGKTYRQDGLYCLIGDLANLPLPDNSLDIILNLLSPANYREFCRVLKPGGLLIKVMPGADYLAEVRRLLRVPTQTALAEQQAVNLWRQTFAETGKTQTIALAYRRPVTPELSAAFLQMSPLAFNHQTADIAPEQLFSEITIDLQIHTAII